MLLGLWAKTKWRHQTTTKANRREVLSASKTYVSARWAKAGAKLFLRGRIAICRAFCSKKQSLVAEGLWGKWSACQPSLPISICRQLENTGSSSFKVSEKNWSRTTTQRPNLNFRYSGCWDKRNAKLEASLAYIMSSRAAEVAQYKMSLTNKQNTESSWRPEGSD